MKQVAFSAVAVLLCLVLTTPPAHAQRGRGGDRGSRGGDRGSRGFGGPPSGFGGRGGDRGSSFGRGGFGGDRGSRGGDRGGRSSFDPSQAGTRIAGFFDKNKDGQLDAGELKSMPSSFRDRFGASGIDLNRGISVSDFGKKTGEAIRQRMEQRERDRGSSDRGRDSSRDQRSDRSRTTTGSKPIFKLSEREKVRASLPEEYAEGDADKDGQVALFEWAAWKRSDMFAFFELDENGDGFLTPRELTAEKSYMERGVVVKKQRLTIVGGSGGSGNAASRVRVAGQSSKSKSTSKRSPEQVNRDKGRGEYYFGALDRDRDGKLSAEEWERSRIVKGMFERAKVPIGAMDKATFMAGYLKAAAASGSGSSSDPRQRWGGSSGGSSSWGGRDRGGSSDRGRSRGR